VYPVKGVGEGRSRIPSKAAAETAAYYYDNEGEVESVLLTRNTTFRWYEREMRSRGLEPGFSWVALEKEALDEHRGTRIEKQRVYLPEGAPQLTGVRVPVDELGGLTDEV